MKRFTRAIFLSTISIALLISCMAFFGCSNQKSSETETTAKEPQAEDTLPLTQVTKEDSSYACYIQLNEQNRVQNDGSFLVQGGWVYGQSWDEEGQSQLIKARSDMNDWTVLDSCFATQIKLVGNYIYYMGMCEQDGSYGIYRMKTSGEGKEKLVDAFGAMQITDDAIYYANYVIDGVYDDLSGDDSRYHLYKCDLNGENAVEVIAKPAFHAFVFSDGILYQDDRDNMSLHVCDLNGNNDVKLNDTRSFFPIYDGEFIYYVCESESGNVQSRTIQKMKTDGSENQLVSPYPVSSDFLLTDDSIYFVYADDSDRLYRIDKDGTDLTLITQDTNIRYVNLFDSIIKYTKYEDGYEFIEDNYFCNYDGSGKWVFRN